MVTIPSGLGLALTNHQLSKFKLCFYKHRVGSYPHNKTISVYKLSTESFFKKKSNFSLKEREYSFIIHNQKIKKPEKICLLDFRTQRITPKCLQIPPKATLTHISHVKQHFLVACPEMVCTANIAHRHTKMNTKLNFEKTFNIALPPNKMYLTVHTQAQIK